MNDYDFNFKLEEIWEGWIDQQMADEISAESELNKEELDELEQMCF